MLALLLPLLASASSTAIPPRAFAEWHGGNARYSSSGVTISIEARDCGAPTESCPDRYVGPHVTVTTAGIPPYEFDSRTTDPNYFPLRFAVGILNKGDTRPTVFFDQFSGGAHCCERLRALVPTPTGWDSIDLGQWDMPQMTWPKDISGDGIADIVIPDNGFYYSFASYAESFAPPRMFNVLHGRHLDVSTHRGFARLFRQNLVEARSTCIRPQADISPNGACAAYVANAARLGRFAAAWTVAMRSYDPKKMPAWLPQGCSVTVVAGQCPKDAVVTYKSYPPALRGFLIDLGYIGARTRIPD